MKRTFHLFSLAVILFMVSLVMMPTSTAYALTCTVTTNADSGAGSLREKIDDVSCNTIDFAGDYTITLASTLNISRNMTIDGVGHTVTVSGNNAVRVFWVSSGVTFNLQNLTVANGFAQGDHQHGGGIHNSGTLNVVNITFSDNRADWWGGGIYDDYITNVTNSTFSNNSALYGGGIISFSEASVVNVTNSTFSGNSATSYYGTGSGVYNAGGMLTLKNSIIVHSLAGINCDGAVNGSNNLADDGSCGGSFTNSASILLGTLGSYGGSTQTFPLLPGSAAIDAGDDATCAAAPVSNLDQRGIARPHGAHCDIGAFESQGFTLTKTGGDNQSAVVNAAFAQPLTVRLNETGGSALAGATITFTAPGSGASAVLSSTTATTNSSGNASITATANGTAGSYNISAGASGATSVNFALTNTRPIQSGPGFVVNTTDDHDDGYCENAPGDCTLREAITAANSAPADNTITFSVDGTITLGSGLPGIANNGSLTIDGAGHTVTVSGNNAVRVFSVSSGATFNLNHLTVANGFVIYGRSGGLNNDGTVNVANSTFSGNTAAENNGGAIYNNGTMTVTNSTFSGNSATWYGGAIRNDGTLTVTNSTFSGNNSSNNAAGGIANYGTLTVKNSIVANNTGGNCYGTIGGSNNLTNDGTCGGNFTNSPSILLGTLGSYGGSTQTFPLLPGSSAIDAGNDSICAAAVGAPNYGAGGLDQRGIARPQGAHCDIGAFESQGFTLTKTGGDNQSAVINTAFASPLSLTVSSSHAEPVNGGKVTFTAPGSGARAAITGSPATIASGSASVTATANGTAGSYNVSAGASGATSVNFALTNNKGTATITLGNLTHEYDGSAKSATATTNPPGLTVTFTYNGSSTPPSAVGTYALVATVNDPNYQGTTSNTFTIRDTTAPRVNTFTAVSPSPVNISITAFTASDTHGIAGYLITQSATPPSAGAAGWTASAPTTYTVTSGGSYTLYPWVKDASGNVSAEFATPVTVVVDTTPPTVEMTSTAPNSTNTSPIAVTVQFSDPVSDFVAEDISAGNATVDNFNPVDADTYTFDLIPSGQGLVTADIAGDVAQDAVGNGNVAATQFSRTYDTVAPYVTSIVRVGSEITSDDAVEFTVTFSEPVSVVETDDFTLNVTGHITGTTINHVASVNESTYTVTVGTGTYNGTLGLNVPISASIADPAGNSLSGLPYTAGQTYTIDKAPGGNTYDDADYYWTYSGNWTTVSGATGPYLGTHRYTNTVGNYAEFKFTGIKFNFTYLKASNRGLIDILVDGTKIAQVNAYSASLSWQQTWTSPTLTAGVHTVRFVHAGGHPYIDVDAIEVFDPPPTAMPGTYDDADEVWTFSNGWTTYSGAGPVDNTNHYANVVGSDAKLTFNGNRFIFTYVKASNRGLIDVYVDGTKIAQINAKSTTTAWLQTWTSPVFTAGVHTLRFVHAGGGTYIDVDAIEILAPSDLTAPAAIGDLSGVAGATTGSVNLSWTAPGDDGSIGTATSYLVRYSTSEITDETTWGAATPVTAGLPTPAVAGTGETMMVSGLTPGASYFFAVRAVDEEGNLGGISNSPAIDAQGITAVPAGTYDDTDVNWLYIGAWTAYNGGGPANNTSRYVSTSGSEAQITIDGEKFAFTYVKASNRGLIDVYVDGTPIARINAKSTSTVWQATWISPTLTPGEHIVRFVHAGANGTYIDVDKIQVFAALGAGDYDDTDAGWAYGGTWTTYSGTGPLSDTNHYTSTVGGDAQLLIDGSGFTLTYLTAPNRGSIDVYVDGVKVGTINARSTTTAWQQTWTYSGLTPGVHTVRFVHAGGGTYIDIDAITILP